MLITPLVTFQVVIVVLIVQCPAARSLLPGLELGEMSELRGREGERKHKLSCKREHNNCHCTALIKHSAA